MTTILPIASPEARLSRVGGKGANLSVLAQAGFAVPPGFLVSTDAYRQFVESNGIQTRLLPLLSGLQGDDPIALDNVSAQIGEFFIQGSLPADTEQAIRSAYNNLNGASVPPGGGLPVAVRSSATAEDLPGMSFAGQQDTYLRTH